MTGTRDDQEVDKGREQEIPFPALILHLYHEQSQIYERYFGMSQSRLMLLREIGLAGEMSQAQLASRLDMEPTLVTRFVKQMEASTLLTRRSDPHDNRFTLVTLTPAGQQIAEQMKVFTHTLETQLIEGLSAREAASIRQELKRMHERYIQLKDADDETDLRSSIK